MRFLVVGATGYLGSEVARQATAAGHDVTGTGSADLDITDRTAVAAFVASTRPDVIVNCAYRQASWPVCADGAANVAAASRARLVHISTDALHSGRPEPYPDDEPPTPVHAYGAAKAAAETAVLALDPGAAVVRTSLIIGDDRSKQIRMALDLATGRREGALFTDEVRCPIAVQDLAAAVLELAASDYAGRLNVAGPEALSYAQLGHLAARHHGLDPSRIPLALSASLGSRPLNVVLDSSRATSLLRTTIRPASETLV